MIDIESLSLLLFGEKCGTGQGISEGVVIVDRVLFMICAAKADMGGKGRLLSCSIRSNTMPSRAMMC